MNSGIASVVLASEQLPVSSKHSARSFSKPGISAGALLRNHAFNFEGLHALISTTAAAKLMVDGVVSRFAAHMTTGERVNGLRGGGGAV